MQAATVLGYGDLRIMITQLLPNMLGPIIVIGTLGMGSAVLAEACTCRSSASASVRPFQAGAACCRRPATRSPPRRGSRCSPALAIFLTVLGLNLLGDGLRDILDPQSRSRRT